MLKVSGMSLEEVARATRSTVGAVKQKAHRAYEKLRALREAARTEGRARRGGIGEMTPDELPALQERIARQILADLRPVSPMPRSSISVAILLPIAAVAVAGGAWHQGTAGFTVPNPALNPPLFSVFLPSLTWRVRCLLPTR
jgi:hypothetical protein